MSSRLWSAVRRQIYVRPSPSLRSRRPYPRAVTARALATTAADVSLPSAPQRSTFRRAATFTARVLLYTSLGVIMSVAPAYQEVKAIVSPPTDTESISLFVPSDDNGREKEDYINNHPLVASLRADPTLTESRPHMKIPPAWRKQSLTAGTLIGPGKVAVPPVSWCDAEGKNFVQIFHVGTDLCGHIGIVHGGFLATVLDEGLARASFPVLPFNVGMTAKLEINYKAPAKADQYLVLRASTVRVEGRKAWVEGHIETLPTEEGQEPIVLATASALFISPRQAATMAKVYPVT